jgi:hypothetical protein
MADSEEPLRMGLTFQIAAIGIAAVVFSFLVALFVFADHDQPGEIIVAPVVALDLSLSRTFFTVRRYIRRVVQIAI